MLKVKGWQSEYQMLQTWHSLRQKFMLQSEVDHWPSLPLRWIHFLIFFLDSFHGLQPSQCKHPFMQGILVFASVMATLGLQIILKSVQTLLLDDDEFELTKEEEKWVVNIMLSVTLVKLLLIVHCRSFSNEIVKAYVDKGICFFRHRENGIVRLSLS